MHSADVMRREAERSSQESVSSLLERMAEKLGTAVRAATIFAEPIEREGVTIIPVAKARFGFGGGGGKKGPEDGGGGGGGARIHPVGFIEMREGCAEFRRIRSALPVPLLLGLLGGFLLRHSLLRR